MDDRPRLSECNNEELCDGKSMISENDKLEYQEAMKLYAFDSGLRRQGLTFAVSVQAIVIVVLSKNIIDSPLQFLALAAVACFVSILSLNNDIRLNMYMRAYETRMLQIEKENNLNLMHLVDDIFYNRVPLLSNKRVFGTFYISLSIGWFLVITVKIFELLNVI